MYAILGANIWFFSNGSRKESLTILSKQSNTGGKAIPDFKLYYRAIAIKNSMILAQKQTQRPKEKNRRS
jgi:hypothetical protein